MFLGVMVGIFLGPEFNLVTPDFAEVLTDWLALPGNLFLQIIKMIIIPLIFSSIIVGLVSTKNPKFLKKIGPQLLLYFIITTTIATSIGFFVGYTIEPGKYIDAESVKMLGTAEVEFEAKELSLSSIPKKLVSILPSNPLESMVRGDMLGVVIFTIIMGISLLFVDKKHLKIAINLLEALQKTTMIIIHWSMNLLPLAVFGLMTQITSKIGINALAGLGMYILTVLVGLLLMSGVYSLILILFAKKNPLKFLKDTREAQLLAFSTSSSAAAIPLSLKAAEEKLKVNPSISNFLIPVGATINMDGTALYQVVATVFLAQVFGINLPLSSMILIVAITVGASIGAPAAPGVAIVILATILESVGIPGAGIALILGVDRILDMSRTAINITGDLTACSFFDRRLGYLFKK
jgi:Na+/H+-dicarboxylate symporter